MENFLVKTYLINIKLDILLNFKWRYNYISLFQEKKNN